MAVKPSSCPNMKIKITVTSFYRFHSLPHNMIGHHTVQRSTCLYIMQFSFEGLKLCQIPVCTIINLFCFIVKIWISSVNTMIVSKYFGLKIFFNVNKIYNKA